MKTAEKVSRLEFPSGYGKDGGGGNTVKLLESTIARFGPIASFRGTYQANRWSLRITQRNHTYLPGNYVFECLSQLQLCIAIEHALCMCSGCACVCVCVVCKYIQQCTNATKCKK